MPGLQEIFHEYISALRNTTLLEVIAVITGIVSVWLGKKENILVFPIGLINTVGYTWLSFDAHLFGEASVNLYYTLVSLYGWYVWSRKDAAHKTLIPITFSHKSEWLFQLGFFAFFYVAIFAALTYLKQEFAAGALPAPDAFASATAFTGMWLMARKKVESWYWWIATNTVSIPLYLVKGLVFTSFYYLILLILAISGLIEWRRKAIINAQTNSSHRA